MVLDSCLHLIQVYIRYMKQRREEQAIQVRFPLDLLEEIRRLAHMHERSFNGEVIWGLRCYAEQQRKEREERDAAGGAAPN